MAYDLNRSAHLAWLSKIMAVVSSQRRRYPDEEVYVHISPQMAVECALHIYDCLNRREWPDTAMLEEGVHVVYDPALSDTLFLVLPYEESRHRTAHHTRKGE